MGAEVLLRAEEIGNRYARISSRIFSSAKRAGKIVENLLDFTRAHTSAGLAVNPGQGNLKEVCEGIVEEVRIHHPDRTIVFEASGQLSGNFDATRIEQAFCNLIENAAVHGAPDSVVTVTLHSADAYAVLTVHNDGQPIDAGDVPHIFDPMTRYSKHAAEERGPAAGLGLGLYITKQIVNAHRGKIEVDSTSEGGTTFIVQLPLMAA